jgi:small subunit ribosomal protein S6
LREYETTIIVQPEISEEGAEAIFEKLDTVLEEHASIRLQNESLGKRKLAYEIRKFNKGHYYIFSYLSDGQVVPVLERNLRLNESILRFMTILANPKVIDIEARKVEAAEMEAEQARKAEERATREAEEAKARAEVERVAAEEAKARAEVERIAADEAQTRAAEADALAATAGDDSADGDSAVEESAADDSTDAATDATADATTDATSDDSVGDVPDASDEAAEAPPANDDEEVKS